MRSHKENRMIPTDYLTGNIDIAKSPLDYLMDKETCEIVDAALRTLDPRKEKIVRDYYGFNGVSKNCREIGEELKVSKSRINTLIAKAFYQLKQPPTRKILINSLKEELITYCGHGNMPARHYVPEWKRPILAHVNRYRYRAYYDFDLRAFLQGKMSTKEMMAYFSTKQEFDY